jgi:hypothetical protein
MQGPAPKPLLYSNTPSKPSPNNCTPSTITLTTSRSNITQPQQQPQSSKGVLILIHSRLAQPSLKPQDKTSHDIHNNATIPTLSFHILSLPVRRKKLEESLSHRFPNPAVPANPTQTHQHHPSHNPPKSQLTDYSTPNTHQPQARP